MAVYLIGYDLMKPGQDYEELFDAIKAVGSTHWHCLDSTWMVVSNMGHGEIRDALVPHLDPNDRLVVLTIAKGAAWTPGSFNQGCQAWLKRHL